MGKIMLRRKEVTSLVLRTVAPGNRANRLRFLTTTANRDRGSTRGHI